MRQVKTRMLEHKVKEIELLVLLNKKIRELLEKRVMMMDKYVSFDAFDDCYITIDDYVYLQSFASSNSFYLPNHILDEFFQKIATRKVVLTPEETVQFGAYAYKGGRVVSSDFLELRDGGVFHDGEKVVSELLRIVYGVRNTERER